MDASENGGQGSVNLASAGSAGGGLIGVTAGTGIAVDNTNPLNPVISNTGVLSITAGPGLSVDHPTGAVTLTLTATLASLYAYGLAHTPLVDNTLAGSFWDLKFQDDASIFADQHAAAGEPDQHPWLSVWRRMNSGVQISAALIENLVTKYDFYDSSNYQGGQYGQRWIVDGGGGAHMYMKILSQFERPVVAGGYEPPIENRDPVPYYQWEMANRLGDTSTAQINADGRFFRQALFPDLGGEVIELFHSTPINMWGAGGVGTQPRTGSGVAISSVGVGKGASVPSAWISWVFDADDSPEEGRGHWEVWTKSLAGGGALRILEVYENSLVVNGTVYAQDYQTSSPAVFSAGINVTGGTVTLPAGSLSAASLGAFSGDVTSSGGVTTLVNIPTAVTMAGKLLATAIAAPTTPAAGVGAIYVDSTSKNLAVKDDAGVVKHGVQTLAAVSNKWIESINDAGLPVATQPAFSNISGSVATTQLPAFTGGDVTTSAGSVVTAIGNNKVTNAMLAQMAARTFKMNNTSGTANAADATPLEMFAASGAMCAYSTAAIDCLTTSSGNVFKAPDGSQMPTSASYYFIAHRLQVLVVSRTGSATGTLSGNIGNDVNEVNLLPNSSLLTSTNANIATAPVSPSGITVNQTGTTANAGSAYTLKITAALGGSSVLTCRFILFGQWVPV